MTAPTLKRSLGDGGAAIDESHGAPSILRAVLQAVAKETGPRVQSSDATPGAGTLATYNVLRDGVLQSFRAQAGTTGTANSTDLELRVNGAAVASLSIDNTDADDTIAEGTTSSPVQVIEGDVITIEATAVATGAADLDTDTVVQAAVVE